VTDGSGANLDPFGADSAGSKLLTGSSRFVSLYMWYDAWPLLAQELRSPPNRKAVIYSHGMAPGYRLGVDVGG
jgi:hypothetical protein